MTAAQTELGSAMSDWDIAALQTSFEGWRREGADDLPADRAFERSPLSKF